MATRMLLWHPSSPGGSLTVLVRWPRTLWVKGPDKDGRPQSFATTGEVVRRYRELRRMYQAEQAEMERKRYVDALWVTHAWTNGPTPCGLDMVGPIAERSTVYPDKVTCEPCLLALAAKASD